MIKKIIDAFLILIYLLIIKIESKITSFDKLIYNKKSDAFIKILKRINLQRSVNIINFLYNAKLFSCLESSIAIRRIMDNDETIKLHIGVLSDKGKHQFHSWISKNGEVIFGNIANLNKHKIIIQK